MMDLLFWALLIVAMKAVAKIAAKMPHTHITIIDIAEKWGYISHATLGYLAASMLPPAMAGLVAIAMFAFYEVMHYVFPESRSAIIEFMAAYTATLIYLYKLPIKI